MSSGSSSASGEIGVGLRNLGNTCFMNTVLQCLAHTPPVFAYMRRQNHGQKCLHRKNEGQNGPTPAKFCSACALEQLVNQMYSRGAQPLSPKLFADNLKVFSKAIQLGRQEDAHEFLRCLLDNLTLHLGQVPSVVKKEGSKHTVVQSWFQGKLQSTIKCMGCGAESHTLDPFLDLSLELQADGGELYRSVEQALKGFTKTERLDGDNGYKCDVCKRMCRATKHFRIHSLPKVLTIHLKRFSFSFGHSGGSGKINAPVLFENECDISPFTVDRETAKYSLFAVAVHQGSSTHSGHYYAFARAPVAPYPPGEAKAPPASWYMFNDSNVRRVSESDVRNAGAYILFYSLNDPAAFRRLAPPLPTANSGAPTAATAAHAADVQSGQSGRLSPQLTGLQIGPQIGPRIGPQIGPVPRLDSRPTASYSVEAPSIIPVLRPSTATEAIVHGSHSRTPIGSHDENAGLGTSGSSPPKVEAASPHANSTRTAAAHANGVAATDGPCLDAVNRKHLPAPGCTPWGGGTKRSFEEAMGMERSPASSHLERARASPGLSELGGQAVSAAVSAALAIPRDKTSGSELSASGQQRLAQLRAAPQTQEHLSSLGRNLISAIGESDWWAETARALHHDAVRIVTELAPARPTDAAERAQQHAKLRAKLDGGLLDQTNCQRLQTLFLASYKQLKQENRFDPVSQIQQLSELCKHVLQQAGHRDVEPIR